jgi:hypothetical protein
MPFVSSPFLPNVISWMPILLATAVIDRPNRGGADGLVLVFLGGGVGVSPRDSCRRSYDAVPSGSGPVHVPPRPAMVLQRLAATPNSGSPATQRLLPTPGTGPPVATCCKPDTTPPATPRHHRGSQPTHGSQDRSRTHPLRRPTHTNPRTSSATPPITYTMIRISVAANPSGCLRLRMLRGAALLILPLPSARDRV